MPQPGADGRGERAVAKVQQYIAGLAVAVLPPASQVSAATGLTRWELLRALRELRSRGTIDFRQGSRVRILARIPLSTTAAPAPRTTSVQKLFDHLLSGVAGGRYRSGDALPKNDYFRLGHGVSPRTVVRAKNMLVEQGHAVRRGKAIVVGAPEWIGVRTPPPFIAVVTRKSHDWTGLCSAYRTRMFGTEFVGESRRCGVRLVSVPIVPDGAIESPDSPSQDHPLLGGLQSSGRQPLGILLSATAVELPSLQAWVRLLSRPGLPLVWLDRNDEGLPDSIRGPTLTRCHISEARAVREAVDYLAVHGHRRAAFPTRGNVAWVKNRLSGIVEAAGSASPPLDVARLPWYDDALWDNCPAAVDRICRDLHTLLGLGIRGYAKAMEDAMSLVDSARAVGAIPDDMPGGLAGVPGFATFTSHWQSWSIAAAGLPGRVLLPQPFRTVWTGLHLLPVLRDPHTTVVIAPNDAEAGTVYAGLSQAGVGFERLSQLSFDGAPTFASFPVSSVDFGFGDLGYQAFHTIRGDVPVRRNRRGDITANVSVVDNGSVSRVDDRRDR